MKLHAVMTAAALSFAAPALAQAPQAAPPTQNAASGTPAQGKDAGKGAEAKKGDMARATLKDANGQTLGEVTLQQTPGGILVRGNLSGVPAGEHAIHIHETGKCEGPDFKTAGGHFNPGKKQHGLMSPKGKHAGDLPNLFVGQDGKLQFEHFANNGLTLKSLMDKDGSAVVVHAKADDHKTDPAGDAGGRIGCGPVEAQ
jgi:Cu-Zn family superoxide dismutase